MLGGSKRGMENYVMREGTIYGKRRRRRPRTRWLDTLKDIKDLLLTSREGTPLQRMSEMEKNYHGCRNRSDMILWQYDPSRRTIKYISHKLSA